jgi:pimeloyl-ACP methyl ester carboxylesterase
LPTSGNPDYFFDTTQSPMLLNYAPPVFDGMEERWAKVSGGRLRYLVGGRGPALLLVHGIAASSFSFRFNCDELMRDFRVFVPDLMNVGYSERILGLDGSLAATAQRLAGFMDDAGLKRANILGSSHGGSVVLKLASLFPERFERLLLVSPANPFARRYQTVVRFYLSPVGRAFVRLAPFAPGRIWNYGIGRMYANPGSMAAGTGIGYARPLRFKGTMHYLLSCLETLNKDIEELRGQLTSLAKIPTLLIWGDRDPVVEVQSGYQLQEALGAEMVVMKGIGHLPYEEAPQQFNRILLEYLGGDPGSRF